MTRNCVFASTMLLLCVLGGAAMAAEPIVYYPFESLDAVIVDESGNGNDGTLNGGVELVEDGHVGGCFLFNGTDSYVELERPIQDDFTITAWVKTDVAGLGGSQAYEGNGLFWSDVGGVANDFVIAILDTKLSFFVGNPDLSVNSNGDVVTGEWTHIAAVRDTSAGTISVYIDGELDNSVNHSNTGSLDAQSVLAIGANTLDGRYYEGQMDEVRIYNEVLTGAEIAALKRAEPVVLAFAPMPRDGSMVGQTAYTLTWRPGDFSVSHDIYFGERLDEVDQATPADDVFVRSQTETTLSVNNLTPGATYYWRVDEVNDVHPDSPWKGDVWSFWVQPLTAFNPSPSDGAPFVLLDPALTWGGGMGALFHTVYFGESFEDVEAMAFGGWMTAQATITPAQLYGPLQPETTYYWRVDEFAMTGTTAKGEVWSFTTLPEIAVADSDLTGWWTLDEGVGANALDWSGNGNHGTFVGDPRWVDGYLGSALEFGSGDYVETGKDAADLGIEGNKPKTTMAWALTRSFNGGGLWDLGSNTDGRNWSVRTMTTTDTWRIQRYGYPTYDFDVSVPTLNEWAHFALVYDGAAGGDDSRLYVNGAVVGNQTVELNTNPASRTFQIGLWSGTSFDGVIDDVRVYKKALTDAEIAEGMRGKPLLAGNPNPNPGAALDIRDATMLSWVAGDTAVSHDVYFGTDRAAVAAADNSAAEFQGNQPGTSFSLAALVEFGGGDYFWRIDEVEATGAVQTGYIWRFTIPDYLIVDNFERYTNEVGSRVFEKWVDGVGFTQPVDTPGNGTGALVGHDIWTVGTPYTTIMETGNVHGGGKAMPIYYDNTVAPGRSKADRTFTPAQNWTVEGVTTLVVHFRGEPDNTGDVYVEINGVRVPYDGDPADVASRPWIAWEIDLGSVGVSLTNIATLTIGIEGGGTGVLYVDDVILTRP